MFEQLTILYLFFSAFVTIVSIRITWLLIFKNIIFQESLNINTRKTLLTRELTLQMFSRDQKEIMENGTELCGSLFKAQCLLFGSLCVLITLTNLLFWWWNPRTKVRLFLDLVSNSYIKF
ncbi:hypothetical protein VP424E501_P0182 [Vibrio phage 424E50-1]|nr:hypothetical protein VP424E501_P0182 [Vibrio phage 424E50-1]